MNYLYYISLTAVLGSLYILLYDWQKNLPRTLRGTFVDDGGVGLILKPANEQEEEIPVRLASGFYEELMAVTKNLNGLSGLFLIINRYIIVGTVNMKSVICYDDFRIRSPYMTPNFLYWLGLPGIIYIFFLKLYRNDLYDPFFYVPMAVITIFMIYVWAFMFCLKSKFVSWQAEHFVSQFECIRHSSMQ